MNAPNWFARLDQANAEIMERLEVQARRENKGRDIDASLAREDAYWRRVGGHDPVVPAITDPNGLYS